MNRLRAVAIALVVSSCRTPQRAPHSINPRAVPEAASTVSLETEHFTLIWRPELASATEVAVVKDRAEGAYVGLVMTVPLEGIGCELKCLSAYHIGGRRGSGLICFVRGFLSRKPQQAPPNRVTMR